MPVKPNQQHQLALRRDKQANAAMQQWENKDPTLAFNQMRRAVWNKYENEMGEQADRRYNHLQQMNEFVKLAVNSAMPGMVRNLGATDLIRTDFLRFLLDGPRDIDAECGFPAFLTPDHYRAMYDREGLACRVVHFEPNESWAMSPELTETADPSKTTPFEQAWDDLLTTHNLWYQLHRADMLSGIGQFGIILLGIDDDKDLREPVEGIETGGLEDAGNKNSYALMYLRHFTEEVCFVKTRETDIHNPRYAQPKIYTIQFRDAPNWGVQAGEIVARDVHWTRVIHYADNRKLSDIYGVPRMQQVYNNLYNCRKIHASNGEGFWKFGLPGISFETHPQVADQGDPTPDEQKDMKNDIEAYQRGLQRYLVLTGLTAKVLQAQLADPTPSLEAQMKLIATAKGYPYRIFFGSEEAKLASGQDSDAWNKRVRKRQMEYVSPMVIRPTVNRFIAMGILPMPKGGKYEIDWPDINTPSEEDRAKVSLTVTQALQAYVQAGLFQFIKPDFFLTNVMGFDYEAVQEALKDFNPMDADGALTEDDPAGNPGNQIIDTTTLDGEMGDAQQGQGTLASGEPKEDGSGDNGNAAMQNYTGRRDVRGKAKAEEAQFVDMPALNARGRGGGKAAAGRAGGKKTPRRASLAAKKR